MTEAERDAAATRAVAALQAGDIGGAIDLLEPLVADAPADAALVTNLGAALQMAGRDGEAAAHYRRALEEGGEPAYLLAYNLGTALAQTGDAEAALAAYRQAVELAPDYAEGHGNLGVTLHGLGRLDEAAMALERAWQLAPQSAWIACNLGTTRLALGRADAEDAYRAALAVEAGSREALRGLAALYNLQGRNQELVGLYRALCQRSPDDAWAHNALGASLVSTGKHTEAEVALRRAVELAADDADAQYNLGVALEQLKRPAEAEVSYRAALAVRPDHAHALRNLARVMREAGQTDEAVALYRRAVAVDPADHSSAHLADALAGATTGAAPASYVTQVFDSYAEQYDDHMTGDLDYQVPGLLSELLAGSPVVERGLDLGCGTGLIAAALRDRARSWSGIDLSPGMLARAETRAIYDSLRCGDLAAVLRDDPDDQYQLVVAGDVLIYLGDLAPLLGELRRVIAAGGQLAFTVEAADGDDDYILLPSGRFAHGGGYLDRIAGAAGFAVRQRTGCRLRNEGDLPVSGWLVLLG